MKYTIEVQSVTHQQILTVGKRIEENFERNRTATFKDGLLQYEKSLFERISKNHQILIKEQKSRYDKEVERVKKESVENLNNALKHEAIRVEKLTKAVVEDFFVKKISDEKKQTCD